jgi:hypothetical protein
MAQDESVDQRRERTAFWRQVIATLLGAMIGFFSSGTIAIFQAVQQSKERLIERRLNALKDANVAVTDAEGIVAEQMRFAEALDALAKRAEMIMRDDSKQSDTDFAKLLEDDRATNGDRQKLILQWAHVRGEMLSANLEMKAVFTNVPDFNLPWPSTDLTFVPIAASDPAHYSAQERLNLYTQLRDSWVRNKSQFATAVDADRNLIRRLAETIRN